MKPILFALALTFSPSLKADFTQAEFQKCFDEYAAVFKCLPYDCEDHHMGRICNTAQEFSQCAYVLFQCSKNKPLPPGIGCGRGIKCQSK